MSIASRVKYHITHPAETSRMLTSIAQRLEEQRVYDEVFIEQPYFWLISGLRPNTTALDIGAYAGETAIYLAMPKEVKSVYSYELMPSSFKRSKTNIKRSALASKIKIINAAVEAHDGTVYAPKDEGTVTSQVAKAGIPVPAVGINTILKGKKNVIIKCDAEGAEERIFANGAKLDNVYKIMLEYHNDSAQAGLTSYLRKKGFKVRVHSYPVTERFIYAER